MKFIFYQILTDMNYRITDKLRYLLRRGEQGGNGATHFARNVLPILQCLLSLCVDRDNIGLGLYANDAGRVHGPEIIVARDPAIFQGNHCIVRGCITNSNLLVWLYVFHEVECESAMGTIAKLAVM